MTGPVAHFKMLELFVNEFNMSFSKEDPRSVEASRLLIGDLCSVPTACLQADIF